MRRDDVASTSIRRHFGAKCPLGYNIILPFSGEITLVALAPLTNVAVAIKLDPEFGKKLKDVTIMGGNTEGL